MNQNQMPTTTRRVCVRDDHAIINDAVDKIDYDRDYDILAGYYADAIERGDALGRGREGRIRGGNTTERCIRSQHAGRPSDHEGAGTARQRVRYVEVEYQSYEL